MNEQSSVPVASSTKETPAPKAAASGSKKQAGGGGSVPDLARPALIAADSTGTLLGG